MQSFSWSSQLAFSEDSSHSLTYTKNTFFLLVPFSPIWSPAVCGMDNSPHLDWVEVVDERKAGFLAWRNGAGRSRLGNTGPTDHWLPLQVWSAALTSPVSWSIPLPCTTSGTRAGPGAVSPLRRPPRWTCWMGPRQSIPGRRPEVRAEAAAKCPGWARAGRDVYFCL